MSAVVHPAGAVRWIARDPGYGSDLEVGERVIVHEVNDALGHVLVRLGDGADTRLRIVRPSDLTDVDPNANCCEHDNDAHDGSGCLDCGCNKAPWSKGFNPSPDVDPAAEETGAAPAHPPGSLRHLISRGWPVRVVRDDGFEVRVVDTDGNVYRVPPNDLVEPDQIPESVRDADARWTYNRWSEESRADGEAPTWDDLDDESRHDFRRFAEDARAYFLAAPVPVSAPEPAAERVTIVDRFHLHDHLEAINERGEIPERCAYDRNGSAALVWLNEEGGDSTYLRACLLRGEDSAQSEPTDIEPEDLAYPLTIVAVLAEVNDQ